jgi:4-diphosphocytidyl-2-C-methyl-D-erythritol kinase
MSRSLILRPPAKINLTLRVGPRRLDGYHDVRTLLQSIAVSDSLTLTARRGPFALQARGPGVPEGRDNIVWRAAESFWRALGRAGEPRDVHLRLEKTIPAAAGLGGGSADAAAALAGLNVIWGARQSRRDLVEIAAGIGSDVPFFLQGGTALAAGRGEEIYPVDDLARLGAILIKPSFGVATSEAYGWLDEDRAASLPDATRDRRPVDVGWPVGPVSLVNDLEAPVARRHPAVLEMIDACLREGALSAAMTGSGSAVYGLFPEPAARRAARRLQRADWLVILTRTLSRREAARRMGL